MTRLLALLLLLAAPAQAEFVLQLPLGATEVYSRLEPGLAPQVPTSAFVDGAVQHEKAPDKIRRTVWQLGGEQTLQNVTRTIVGQLESRGYDVLLDCVSAACGGFDFRFAIDVVDEPVMRVDLRQYRFISARQALNDAPGYVTFLISRSPVAVYVQMTEYAPTTPEQVAITAPASADDDPPDQVAEDVPASVKLVLEGLEFEPGSATITGDPEDAIERLAAILTEDTSLKVLLVGHSDMSGTLKGNIAVSKARANAVLQALVKEHGIDPARLSAHGVGFLSPRASNATEAGRQKNRRVEAVFSR